MTTGDAVRQTYPMSAGQIARHFDVNVSRIHYVVANYLVYESQCTKRGWRWYDRLAVERIGRLLERIDAGWRNTWE